MATFKSNCPHCHTQLDLEREWIGMEVECPECQKSFPVTPPAQSAPKRQLPPPPPLPKQNPPMGNPFAPPLPPKQNNPMGNPPHPQMMNEITAKEYLYQRNKKILNIFAIICIILSIASATLAVINGLFETSSSQYDLFHVRNYVERRDNDSRYQYTQDNWSFELLYNENMSKDNRYDRTFYTLTTGEAMIFDVTNTMLSRQISTSNKTMGCIVLSCAAVIFMMLAIFLKLCQISYCIAISRK